MKNFFLLGLIAISLVSCQQQEQRYFADSAETETLKAAIAAYESGDWEQWRSHFVDTAKVYVNSTDAVSIDERLAQFKEMTPAWDSYGFEKEDQYWEMVKDKEDETWVYFWGTHAGTIKPTGKNLRIPVHLAVQFVDGKVVEEHVFFDGTAMNAEMLMAQNSDDMKTVAMSAQNNIVKAWNTFDADLFKATTSADLKRSTNGVVDVNSQDEYVGFMTAFHTGFPDFKVTVDNTSFADGKLFTMWTVVGTNTGEFMGNAPTGKSITTHGLSVWSFDGDGKPSREDAFYNNMSVFQQLGISPPEAQ